jgi:hypothetical protein
MASVKDKPNCDFRFFQVLGARRFFSARREQNDGGRRGRGAAGGVHSGMILWWQVESASRALRNSQSIQE